MMRVMEEARRLDLALLDVAAMAAVDRAAIAAGIDGAVLMERAGRAVADAVSRRSRPGASVLVLSGPGANGGDGFVAARLLRERGHAVTLALAGRREALSGDSAAMAGRWTGPIMALDACEPARHDIIVDALLGAGLNRPLTGAIAGCVARIGAASARIVAVDVPSGLSGDTGQAQGPVVRADETVTFFRLKPGHLLYPGRGLCGVVSVADIGIEPRVAFGPGGVAPRLFRNEPGLWLRRWPVAGADVHKYRRGAVLALAGGLSGVGASRLAARAALRIGAGLVTLACRPEALAAHAGRGPDALINRAIGAEEELAAILGERRLGCVVAGPALGLDARARRDVLAVLRAGVPAVLDADALTILAARPRALPAAIAARGAACVLTPHEGEFARLFGENPEITQARSKLERARHAASVTGAVIVLKGADTVVAHPGGEAAINPTGSQALATAGTGDVLAGMIGGLIAQGMPAFEAACAAVWLHGKAGETCGHGLIADDLPEALPSLLAALQPDPD